MKNDHISKIETAKRKLHGELARLKRSHPEHFQSIAGFADVAAHEHTRKDRSHKLLKYSREGLTAAVVGFESSHPELVEAANEFCELLAQVGI